MANVRYRVWSPSSRKQITGFYLTWICLIDMIVEIYLLFYHFALYVLYKILLFEKCLCHLIQYDIITYKMNHFYIVWNDAIIDLFLALDWLISMNIMKKKNVPMRDKLFSRAFCNSFSIGIEIWYSCDNFELKSLKMFAIST